MPPSTIDVERPRRFGQPVASDRPIPIIGLISGATSIAPITTAVESDSTPAAEMTDANSIIRKNLPIRAGARSPSKNTCS